MKTQEHIDNISKQEKKIGKANPVPEKQARLKEELGKAAIHEPNHERVVIWDKADIPKTGRGHEICGKCGYGYGLHRVVGFNCPEYNPNGRFEDWAKTTFTSCDETLHEMVIENWRLTGENGTLRDNLKAWKEQYQKLAKGYNELVKVMNE